VTSAFGGQRFNPAFRYLCKETKAFRANARHPPERVDPIVASYTVITVAIAQSHDPHVITEAMSASLSA
jgi:hypothetical protein